MESGDLLREFYEYLDSSQWWPTEKLREHQRVQLEELLRFAKNNVPFYANRLAPLFKANGEIDWDKWHSLPLLGRADISENRDAMQARDLPPSHGPTKTFFSSGTTGTPAEITHTGLSSWFSRAATYRADEWHGLDWSQNFCQWAGDDPTADAWPNGRNLGSWGPPWKREAKLGKLLRINRATPADKVAEYVVSTDSAYLNCRSRGAHSICLEAERCGIPLKLKAILAHGSIVTDAERDDCFRIAGAPIYALYSSKEGLKMAHPCPTGLHYHVNAEIVLLEILDAVNRPCAVGESGRIVVTPLFSTAQPLIRYDTGDIGSFGPQCACGRGLPVLSGIEGRATQLFRLPGGRRIAPSIPADSRKLVGAVAWQIAQVAPLVFEVRYVEERGTLSNRHGEFVALARQWLHPEAEIKLVRVLELPLTAAGKFLEYVCELPPDA